MKNFNLPKSNLCSAIVLASLMMLIQPATNAQVLDMSKFVIFSGNVTNGATNPASPGRCVQISSSTSISGGAVGSYNLVKTNGSASISSDIHSGGTIVLGNSNSVSGKITAANSGAVSGTVFSAGSGSSFSGNIDVNGKIVISGGSVSGKVTHPVGTTYSGPNPTGGNVTGPPTLPVMPTLPPITPFPAYANTPDITTTQSISPGSHGKIKLQGNKTLTFNGPGVYVFKSILNSSNNTFKFNFQNAATGNILIYVHENVDLGKLGVSLMNGGSANRIYLETHGNGSSSSNGTYAFVIANGSSGTGSKWMGTVWAPYAAINIGTGTGNTSITGALWSGTQVNLNSNVSIVYGPFASCVTPNVEAGANNVVTCYKQYAQLIGSSTTPGATFSWTASNGGNIVSDGNTTSPIVNAVGTYTLTVTSPSGGCTATDQAFITLGPCIYPYYTPPENGKTVSAIGSELTSLYFNFNPNVSDTLDDIYQINSDSVWIEVISLQGQYPALLSLLQTTPYGITNLIDNGPNTLIISGLYPVNHLKKLDSLPTMIDYVRPLFPPITMSGIIDTKGDIALHSDFVRAGYDVMGEGIKLGVISDSYNTILGDPAATDIVNYDLPGSPTNPVNPNPVNVLLEFPFGRRSDEGRAMLQIIHDIAPKAELVFRTGFISAGNFAQGILELEQEGCDGVVDDVTFITEPFFEDGVVAQAVDQVTAAGVSYFSAAGNFGNKSYQHQFVPVPAPNGIVGSAHEFAPGDIFQNLILPPGTYTIVMQWTDSIYSGGQTQAGTGNDLDIYLTTDNGITLFGFNRNNLGGDPLEVLPFVVGGTDTVVASLLITRAAGLDNVILKYIMFRGEGLIAEHNSGTSTCVGQANAAGAMAVGAVLYTNTPAFGVSPPTVASFSSRGGTPVHGVVREKPDFTAPNGGNTSVFLGGPNFDSDLFPNFFGTSAAAPHALGVAALLMEARNKYYNDTLSPEAVRSLLQSTAVEMYTPGYDVNSGYGFIDADAAMRTFAAPTPGILSLSLPTPTTVPGEVEFIVTVNGNYLTAGSQIIFRGDTLPTTVLSSNQLSATVPTFFGNPPIQIYNPPITPSGDDGGYSDSIFFFAPVKDTILVTADNKTKKYGEQLPLFTSTILYNGQPFDSSGKTLADVGLDSLQYSSSATSLSNTGIYFIHPFRDPFDLNDSIDIGLLESYIYIFEDGFLSIDKMDLTIIPENDTVIYGEKIEGITFDYLYDDSLISVADQNVFLNSLETAHTSEIADELVLLEAKNLVNGRMLHDSDLTNMCFMVSAKSLLNARNLLNAKNLLNSVVYDSTDIVDVDPECIFNYQVNANDGILVNAKSLLNAKNLINAKSLLNAKNLLNGTATLNAKNLLNGSPQINSSNVGDNDGPDIAIIVDDDDTTSTGNDTLYDIKSINVITGVTVGTWRIAPGAFLTNNFNITYGLGTLTILPATLVVKADDQEPLCNSLPDFSSTISGYVYDDDDTVVIATGPSYTILDDQDQEVNGIPDGGIYTIVPGGIVLATPPNYVIQYENGIFTQPDLLTLGATPTQPLCYGETGSVSLTPGGGTLPYIFSGDETTELEDGTYNYIVTDGNGCTATASAIVNAAPDLLTLTATPTQPLCFGDQGSVELSADGGVLDYIYSGDDTENLDAGTYNYLVTDGNGCTASATAMINAAPDLLTLTATPTQPLCFGDQGSVELSADGGVLDYIYSGDNTANLDAGTYNYLVTDGDGCTASSSAMINAAPDPLTLTATPTQPLCFGDQGSVELSADGGVLDYIYSGDNTVNLDAGTYNYLVTDGNGCTATAVAIVNNAPALLTLTATPSQPSCFGGKGSVLLSASGGTQAYQYGGDNVTNLTDGTYDYTVSDANGCTSAATATIVVPTQVSGTASSTPSGCGVATGSATANPSGGTPGYTYYWSPSGQTTKTALGIATGNYIVTITDSKGCTTTASAIVGVSGSAPAIPTWQNGGDDNHTVGVCGGTWHDYEIAGNPLATHTWSAPAGCIISNRKGNTGNPLTVIGTDPFGQFEVTVYFPSGFVSGSINVYATNACGNSPTASLAVQSKTNAPGAISGPVTNVCKKTGQIYSIAAVNGATSYSWTVPSGASITNNYGTSIKVSFGNSFTGSGNITVKANNFCGSSPTSSLTVYAPPAQPGNITGATQVCKSQLAGVYSIAAVTGATSYTWTISGGASFVGSTSGSTVTVKFSNATSTTANLIVKANNYCGASVVKTLAITVDLLCRTVEDELSKIAEWTAYPNPTSGKLIVSFNANSENKYQLKIVDIIGKIILLEDHTTAIGQNLKEIDLSDNANGLYFLILEGEGLETKTLRITRQ